MCEEWFLRSRGLLLRISSAAGCHQHTAYHGMQRLHDLRRWAGRVGGWAGGEGRGEGSIARHCCAGFVEGRGHAAAPVGGGGRHPAAAWGRGLCSIAPSQPATLHQAQAHRISCCHRRCRCCCCSHLRALLAAQQELQVPSQQARDKPQAPGRQQASGDAGRGGPGVDGAAESAKAASSAVAAALAGLDVSQPPAAAAAPAAAAVPPAATQQPQLLQHSRSQPHATVAQAPAAHPPAAAADQQQQQRQQVEAGLKRIVPGVLEALAATAAALCALHDGDALAGLHAWACDSFAPLWSPLVTQFEIESAAAGPAALQPGAEDCAPALLNHPLGWLAAAAAQAAGRHEQALAAYAAFRRSPAGAWQLLQGASLQGWLVDRMAECYAAVGDWSGLAHHAAAAVQLPLCSSGPDGRLSAAWAGLAYAGGAGASALQQWDETWRQQQQASGRGSVPAGLLARPARLLMQGTELLEGATTASGGAVAKLLQQIAAEEGALLQAAAAAAAAGWPLLQRPSQVLVGLQLAELRLRGAIGSGTSSSSQAAPACLQPRLAADATALACSVGGSCLAADGGLRASVAQDGAQLVQLLSAGGGAGGLAPAGHALACEALVAAHRGGNQQLAVRLLHGLRASAADADDRLLLQVSAVRWPPPTLICDALV